MRCGRDMEAEVDNPAAFLTEMAVADIELFCDVARANGSTLSLKDLIALTSIDCSEKELADSWKLSGQLSSRFRISSGLILDRVPSGQEGRQENTVRSSLASRLERATSNVEFALRYGALLERAGAPFKVLSISGSTSYLSVSETDDLDFFAITKSGAMWGKFVGALILARVFRLMSARTPSICLSYVADEAFVTREFSGNQNGLFARDAISTRVIFGEQYFLDLLKENCWMGSYFPKLYGLRTTQKTSPCPKPARPDSKSASALERIANLFLYCTAGTYIRVKSSLLNRRFTHERRFSSLFNLRIGPDHCVYESLDYLRLRRQYANLSKKEKS
jgi:hypothetical protein